MARVFRYPTFNPLDRPVSTEDLLIGTDSDNSDDTKTYPISQVITYVRGQNLLVDLGADFSILDSTEVSVTGGGPSGKAVNTINGVNHRTVFPPGYFSKGDSVFCELFLTLSGDYPVQAIRSNMGPVNFGLFTSSDSPTSGTFDLYLKAYYVWASDTEVSGVPRSVATSSLGEQFFSINPFPVPYRYDPSFQLTWNLSGALLGSNLPGIGISTLVAKRSAIWVFKKQV